LLGTIAVRRRTGHRFRKKPLRRHGGRAGEDGRRGAWRERRGAGGATPGFAASSRWPRRNRLIAALSGPELRGAVTLGADRRYGIATK